MLVYWRVYGDVYHFTIAIECMKIRNPFTLPGIDHYGCGWLQFNPGTLPGFFLAAQAWKLLDTWLGNNCLQIQLQRLLFWGVPHPDIFGIQCLQVKVIDRVQFQGRAFYLHLNSTDSIWFAYFQMISSCRRPGFYIKWLGSQLCPMGGSWIALSHWRFPFSTPSCHMNVIKVEISIEHSLASSWDVAILSPTNSPFLIFSYAFRCCFRKTHHDLLGGTTWGVHPTQ